MSLELFEGRAFTGLLFDMDGTLLSSVEAAERVWAEWARRHGVPVDAFLPTIHGVRSEDTIRRLGLPDVDPVAEAAAITRAEIADVRGVTAIAGAIAFTRALPLDRWAIVTSAPVALARARLAAAGVPPPSVLITAEDVRRGKPDPEGYTLAAARLGTTPSQCLILEDAAAGIEAAERAHAAVLVVTAAHHHAVRTPHPTCADYRLLDVRVDDEGCLILRKKDRF